MIEISKIDVFIGLAINGVFTGLGTAIGSYLATRHITNKVDIFLDKIKKLKGGKYNQYVETNKRGK